METIIYTGSSKWGRSCYIKLIDHKVQFDDSDEEYGPIIFDLDILIRSIEEHKKKLREE